MTTLLSMPELSEVTSKCPHADIRFCPLYHASHTAQGLGCDDGKLDRGSCGVSRALDYGKLLAALTVLSPQMVALCAFQENADQSKQQRDRNMKASGLH